MAHVLVSIMAPDGRTYRAEVDENSSAEALLNALIKTLHLPLKTEDGNPVKYGFSLLNALGIREGVTIKISRANPAISSQFSSEEVLERSVYMSNKVFIVHGHDAEAKESVGRFIIETDPKDYDEILDIARKYNISAQKIGRLIHDQKIEIRGLRNQDFKLDIAILKEKFISTIPNLMEI